MFPMKNVAGGPFNLKHSMHAFRYPEIKYRIVPIVSRNVNDHRSDEQARSSCKGKRKNKMHLKEKQWNENIRSNSGALLCSVATCVVK